MIPISLTLKGLYSYREAQTIDFEKLTSSQLFGIFGPIGCGKSSILEAIMFALYDQSDRLKTSGDNRYYNMLNLQSDELEIDFIFRSNASKDTKHRVYFRASRNRNHYDQVSVRSRDLYVFEDNDWIPIKDKDASRILGMNYYNFMQTVIIPQGKFRDFVDQNPTRRTQMLKELFRLEKFELGQKTGSLLKKTQLDVRGTEDRLSEVGAVSEDEIQQARQEAEKWEKALVANQQKLQEAEQACQQQEDLRKLFENIRHTEQELSRELQQQEYFQKREQQLSEYNRAVIFFKEKLLSLADTRKQIEQLWQSLEKRQQEIKQREAALKAARANLSAKQEVYEQREQKEQQCQDLEHIIEIRKYKEALRGQAERLKQARQQADSAKQQKEALCQQISADEEKLGQLDIKLKHQPELQQLAYWHETHRNLEEELKDGQEQEKQYAEQQKKIQLAKNEVLTSYNWAQQNGSLENYHSLIREKVEACRQEQEKISEALQELQISEKIASFAESLQDGTACPLCGSTHHPEVVHHQSVTQQLYKQRSLLKQCKKDEKDLQQLSDKINNLYMDYKSKLQLQQELDSRQKQVKHKIEKHLQHFRWEEFKKYQPEEIQGFLKKLESLAVDADKLRQKLKTERQQQQKLDEQLEQVQEMHNKVQQQETSLTTSIDNRFRQIKLMSYDKFESHDLPSLTKSLEKGRHQLKVALEEYEKAQASCFASEKKLGSSQTRLEAEREQLENQQQRATQLDKELEQLCQEKNFSNLEKVQHLVAMNLDTEQEQAVINDYKTRLGSLQTNLEKLKNESKGKTYQATEHHQWQQTLTQLKQEVQECQENGALSRQQVKILQERLQSSQQLRKRLEGLQKREENLKELRKLFTGSGFVKYVSSVYLDNLCRTANERFMKLTRNNLSLELNQDGEFIVRDYLNNGNTRLLKTLSGGQTFQAALCLALALAENVKALNQADQSFFFLDEGFGSLDRESLRVVFETLKSLRQEKRIVGIISHVEELQQEIDIFLQIENDREQGSLIKCSWE